MRLHSLPNDILPNLNPLTILLLIPLLDRLIYPFLRTRLHLSFSPMTRITLGFLLAACAMLYAAFLQHRIYTSPPCYSRPAACPEALRPDGTHAPNDVHIAWQIPAYVLIALSEIFASITGLEIAYQRAPGSMKSFIMSLFLLTSAGGSALGVLVAPLARDPWVGWVYGGLSFVAGTTGVVFWRVFGGEREGEGEGARGKEEEEGGFELASRSSFGGEEETVRGSKAV